MGLAVIVLAVLGAGLTAQQPTATAAISGTVTDGSNAQPLQFAPVAVFSSGGLNLGSVNTDASGNYTKKVDVK